MGFFKRLFSIASKKNKSKSKRSITPTVEQITPAINDEEHEAAIGKLLRFTSTRFTETSELNYAALPPIPHPINKIIQTPASSTISLETDSLFQRGTYNVTVHRRRRHASTEFPHANRDLENNELGSLQPVEDSRLLGLRSDPSVASLLELYDEHGRVASDAFANDESLPVHEGHAQVRRNGSTLRQLLGGPSTRSGNDDSEGDISWAERYLAGSDATSVSSSSGLRTPEIFTGGITAPEVSITSDVDLSFATFDNPAVSSMEVEVNNSYDVSREELDRSSKTNSPYTCIDPATPQRASQIFDFLTKQKQSIPPVDLEGTFPDLPSCFSSPSEEGNNSHRRSFESRDSLAHASFNPKRFSAPPIPLDIDTQKLSRPRSSLIDITSRHDTRRHLQEPHSAFSDDSHDGYYNTPSHPQPFVKQAEDPKRNDVQILMSGPTRVILTAPTPGTNHIGPSRLLSGPRPNRKSSSRSIKKRRSVLGEVSSNSPTILGDPFLIVSPKQKPHRDRRSSTSSSRSSFSRQEYERDQTYISHPKKTRPSSPASNVNKLKENQLSLSVKNDLPSTPLRSKTNPSSRSLFKNVVHLGMMLTPAHQDPNLSSELSPVGRQIMDDVRHQRSKAKEAVRSKLKNRF